MRQIINGRMYDTDTATLVADYTGRICFNYIEGAGLYQKKNGEWFFVIDEERSYIKPATELEAKEWLADYNFVDEYIEHFGEPEE